MNLIGSRARGWWRDPDGAVRGLVEELQGFSESSGHDVTVVFDRRPRGMPEGDHGGVVVGFARERGRNAADHEIVRRVEADPDPASVMVVTSDRELADRVRDLGASVESVRGFDERLGGG